MTGREYVGTLVKNLNPLHDLEYKTVFNLHENTFFQKLVSREVLERVRVKPIDYFKALMFLDYFTRIVEKDFAVCDNLERLSKAIRDEERKEGIDKGEKGASYLNLETVVFEAGIWAKEKGISKKSFGKKEIEEIRKRYQQEKQIGFDAREPEPFYDGIGEMVCQQVGDKMKPYLIGTRSRADLGAIVFIDSILTFIEDKSVEAAVYSKLESKDYFSASILALKQLIGEASLSKIKSAIEKNV